MVELSDEKVLYAFDKTLEPALTVPSGETVRILCSRAGLPDGPRAAAAPGLPGGRFRGRALPEMH